MLAKGSLWLSNWLSDLETKSDHKLDKSLLFGIGEGAALQARTKLNIDWANVAVRSYEYLAQIGTSSERNSALSSAMNLRAFLISKLGLSRGHPVLDPEIIIKWFNAESKYSLSQLREMLGKGAPWKSLPEHDVLELRRIKNRINVLRVLADNSKLAAHTDLESWLRLWNQLP